MRPEAGLALPLHGPTDLTRTTRDRVDILSDELASGRSSDIGRALRSDFSGLSRLTHDLERLDATAVSLSRAGSWAATAQASFSGVEAVVSSLYEGISTAAAGPATEGLLPQLAEDGLRDVAALLNVSDGGRAIFSSGGPDHPIEDIDAVLTDIRGLAAGSGDYATYAAAVDAYFAQGGTYEMEHLSLGPDRATFPAGEGRNVAFDFDASSEELRQAVAQLALAAGLSDAAFDVPQASDAAQDLFDRIAQASGDLPKLRGRLGAVEERIGDLSGSVDDARSRTETAIAEATGIDMFEAASKLQNEMSRLETLYAITARRAQLRLTDYL